MAETINVFYLCRLCGAQIRGEEITMTPIVPPKGDPKRRTNLAETTGKVHSDLSTHCPKSPDGRHELSNVIT